MAPDGSSGATQGGEGIPNIDSVKKTIATYYGDQAKAAAKKATEHEAMAAKYANVMGKTDWPTHCRSLASYYRKLAEEYDAMAKLHGEHAAELRKKK